MGKILYKVLATLFGLVGGLIAGAIFQRLWKVLPGAEQAPRPTDEDSRWREVLPAAALQGAIAGGVRAAVQRGGATGVRHLTGTWPG